MIVDLAGNVWTPTAVDPISHTFPANVVRMMPAYDQLPEEFKGFGSVAHPMSRIASRWFCRGLSQETKFYPREGIDADTALRHLDCIMRSFQPKHEHKIAGVGFLLHAWFEKIEGVDP